MVARTVGVESTIIGFDGDEPVLYRLGGTPVKKLRLLRVKYVSKSISLRIHLHQDNSKATMHLESLF